MLRTLYKFVLQPDIPTFTVQPQSATYAQGQTATALSVSVTATGNGTLTYQWYKDGEAINGATSATYTPPTATIASMEYYCVVTNTLNGTSQTVTSNIVTITVTEPIAQPDIPTISVQPQSATYTQGQTATALSVTATGNGTLTYQWYKDGEAIADATSATYTPPTDIVSLAEYHCVVTNTLNGTSQTTTSNVATIAVSVNFMRFAVRFSGSVSCLNGKK